MEGAVLCIISSPELHTITAQFKEFVKIAIHSLEDNLFVYYELF
jgi:hypothetical protein